MKKHLQSIADQRSPLLAPPSLKTEDLYLASQSPFAAVCFQSVLPGDLKFTALRMQQKRLLRGVDFGKDALVAKQLDTCAAAAKADNSSIDEKTRVALLTECAELRKRLVPKSEVAT